MGDPQHLREGNWPDGTRISSDEPLEDMEIGGVMGKVLGPWRGFWSGDRNTLWSTRIAWRQYEFTFYYSNNREGFRGQGEALDAGIKAVLAAVLENGLQTPERPYESRK